MVHGLVTVVLKSIKNQSKSEAEYKAKIKFRSKKWLSYKIFVQAGMGSRTFEQNKNILFE